MKRNISDIPCVLYGYGGAPCCEPSSQEIQLAITDNQLEERGFQSHNEELGTEWRKKTKTKQEFDTLVRTYHARRIAHFVVHGWTEPIMLTAEGRVKDGLHRLKAAIYQGMTEIDVIIVKVKSKGSAHSLVR